MLLNFYYSWYYFYYYCIRNNFLLTFQLPFYVNDKLKCSFTAGKLDLTSSRKVKGGGEGKYHLRSIPCGEVPVREDAYPWPSALSGRVASSLVFPPCTHLLLGGQWANLQQMVPSGSQTAVFGTVRKTSKRYTTLFFLSTTHTNILWSPEMNVACDQLEANFNGILLSSSQSWSWTTKAKIQY